MDDIYAIRLRNLIALLASPDLAALKQKEQALQLNTGSSMLSQLTAGKKMGDDIARKIELARGLPVNWMDNVHAGDQVSQSWRLDPEMIAESIEALRRVWARRGLVFDPVAQPEMVVYAYELLAEMGDEPSSAQLIDFGAKLAERDKAKAGAGDERDEDKRSSGVDRTRAKGGTGKPA